VARLVDLGLRLFGLRGRSSNILGYITTKTTLDEDSNKALPGESEGGAFLDSVIGLFLLGTKRR